VDKRVIFAVAGSGKTTHIVASLDLEKRFLLVTYTDNNFSNLRRKIVERFGFLPSNIVLLSYFTFLHSFCFRPFLLMKMRTKGINFDTPPAWPKGKTDDAFYVDRHRRLYHNRIADLLVTKRVMGDVTQRIEKYIDVICIDEVQDFGGYDFDLLMAICRSKVNVLLVGDFYQHTFDTSRDGNKSESLHDDYETYMKRFEKIGLDVDTTSLSNSYRCSPSVCEFIRKHLGIEIHSHAKLATDTKFLEGQDDADRLFACAATVKLFYQEHYKYHCYSENWGKSKGMDHYHDVCVVLNDKASKDFQNGVLREAAPRTKNKLYVACSRARGNLYLMPGKLFKKFKRL